jgi:hypothetical protein
MNRTRIAVLAVLGTALVSMSGCRACNFAPKTGGQGHGEGPGPNQHFGQMDSRNFEVYIYTPDPNMPNQCLLDWPVGILWRSKNQTVTWFSDDDKEYTVDFGANSPFKQPDPTFDVKSKPGFLNSGPLQQNASGYYSFSVHAGDKNGTVCKKATDPDPGYYVK